jgi:acyl carrier protein
MRTEDRLRQFIIDELNWNGRPDELTDSFPLIENGAVDSLGIFRIVSFIEDEFDVEILDEELVPQHFGTIGGVAHLVDGKTSSSARD